MREYVISFEKEKIFSAAEAEVMRMCRFDPTVPLHRQMMRDAAAVGVRWSLGRSVSAAVSFFENFSLQNSRLLIGGETLQCSYFAQAAEADPVGIWVFSLTFAPFDMSEKPETPMEALYADLWGTACVEAAVLLLKKRLKKDSAVLRQGKRVFLSNLFGPGYYGTSLQETGRYFRLSKGDKIGIGLTENGTLLPEKSCTGLFFAAENPFPPVPAGCVDCCGAEGGCAFCSAEIFK